MQKVYDKIQKISKSKASVFIIGESGTGKELCAQAIHKTSQRRDKSFITLNCAAISPYLAESELFGHVKGSFTGADRNRPGVASLADGGSLFLDEIGEMDLDLQRKLLHFIQNGTFQKIGNSKLETSDIRFLCATNRDPITEIEARRFREDLFHRLKVITILLPPLRQRGKDVLFLAQAFLNKYAQQEQKSFKEFSLEAEEVLLHYQWPGNVRQLQNVVHNLVLLNEGEVITADMVLATLEEEPSYYPNSSASSANPPQPTTPLQKNPHPTLFPLQIPPKTIRPFREVEKDTILEALEYCNGKVEKAAKLLEISPATIYRKKQQWNK